LKRRLSGGAFCAVFDNGERAIDGDVLQNIHAAADPADLDAVNPVMLAQSEVEARAVVALVASAGVDLGDLGQLAGHDFHVGSHAVAIGLHSAEPDLEPMVSGHRLVSHLQNGDSPPLTDCQSRRSRDRPGDCPALFTGTPSTLLLYEGRRARRSRDRR
jgi:hypothetical protein